MNERMTYINNLLKTYSQLPMARKRMIDPTLWQDEEFGSLTPLAKVLFIGLFSNADDEGRIKANCPYIKSIIFMYDDITTAEIQKLIIEVKTTIKSVIYYEVNGKPYIQLKNWDEFQKQHKDRIQPSTLPPYVEGMTDNVGQVTDNVGVSKDKISKDKIREDSILAKKSQEHEKLPEKTNGERKLQQPTELQGLVEILEHTLNTKIVNWGKQAKAWAMMKKAGYTREQIEKSILYMATRDEFFNSRGFDLMTVANNIPRFKVQSDKAKGAS